MRKQVLTRTIAFALALSTMATPVLAVENMVPAQENGVEQTDAPIAHAPQDDETDALPPEEEKKVLPLELPEGYALRTDHVNYMSGFPQREFQPNTKLTRAQVAQILYRLLADPDSGKLGCHYVDIPEGQWYTHAVRALVSLGLFNDGTYFRPDELITRAEFVDLLVRIKPAFPKNIQFTDVSDYYWGARQI